ncbi:hypothetical protein RHMOL_Rhmol08G0054700 [Rhododendron molle]|uniref:Uncharacterized protein n=1 Tax=Rhododendron molle TaxID=49168 RepID=A0ACC0MKT6_RHOML|nr:hypothetical protein RHMOL_Rhmol08G0054700 [Rhododendron molle]
MALNLWHFPTHSKESSLFSGINSGNGYQMEGCLEKNSAGVANFRDFYLELENSQNCSREKTEKASDNIVDLLPPDPFGMDLSSTFTAIKGWIEDIENDLDLELRSLGFFTDPVEVERVEDRLPAGLNLVCNGVVKLRQKVDNSKIQDDSVGHDKYIGGGLFDGNIEEFMHFSYDKYWVSSDPANEFQGCSETQWESDGGAPHDALLFTLGYLGVRDLLSVERVCKSLRDAVQNDSLIWRNIHIDQPLSHGITDDALLRLTSRAQGTLQCLSLVQCLRITDSGLTHVIERNPGLKKLSVPGCLRLSIEGILCNLKYLKAAGKLRINNLRIGGLYGITNKQFEELKFLLGADNPKQLSTRKPRFYGGGKLYLSCDDDRAIDIEACPRCQKLRQVYDCPAERCQGKNQSTQLCRACTMCIARCIHCGCCINDTDYEETFCLDLLCLDCWKQLLNSQEEMDVNSSKCTIFHQQARYHFCFYG